MTEWSPPSHVTIPIPIPMAKKRGYFAKKVEDFPTSIRMTPNDKLLAEEAAALCGVTFSVFARWCTMQVTREVMYAKTGIKPHAQF